MINLADLPQGLRSLDRKSAYWNRYKLQNVTNLDLPGVMFLFKYGQMQTAYERPQNRLKQYASTGQYAHPETVEAEYRLKQLVISEETGKLVYKKDYTCT